MLLLRSDELRAALPISRAISVLREAAIALSTGQIEVPARTVMQSPAGVSIVMPASWPARGAATTKLITVYPENAQSGLPAAYGLAILQETSTGRPLALIEGATLTALRTSALVAIAADLLWQGENPTIALIGAGQHARLELEAVVGLRPPGEVRIASRRAARAHELARSVVVEPWLRNVPVRVLDRVEDAVRGADIILCATSSPSPVLRTEDVSPGAHVSAIGAFTPTTRELPSELVERAVVVVDSLEGAREEAGDLLIPLSEGRFDASHFDRELGEVLAGKKTARSDPSQTTVFKSVGSAAFDVATALAALEEARRRGLGTEIRLH